MDALERRLRRCGGIASVRELRATPSEQRALARASMRGVLTRVRRGVYAVRDAPHDVILAGRIGGRLTGVSALHYHGLWVPPAAVCEPLHVEVRVATTIAPHAAPTRIRWTREQTLPQFGVAPLESVLAVAAQTLTREQAVAVLDSALRRTPLTPHDLDFLAAGWKPEARAAASLTDERSDSGTESVLRVLLLAAGIRAVPQPRLPIADFARADLLIGDRFLIECDSEGHHSEPAHRRADIDRDALLMSVGFLVMRVDYRRVFGCPEDVISEISAVVERGEHMSARPTV